VLPKASAGQAMMLAGLDLVLPAKGPEAAIFGKLQTVSIEAGETAGKGFVNIVATAATAKDADRIRVMV